MVISIMGAYAVSTGAISKEKMTEEQLAQYEQAQEEMAAQMSASGATPTKLAIAAVTLFAIGLCIQFHYVLVARRLQANLRLSDRDHQSGGVRIGGGECPEGGDVAAARASYFELQRIENNNRGLTKESAIKL